MNKIYLLIIPILFSFGLNGQSVVHKGEYLQFSGGAKMNTLYDSSIGAQHYNGIVGSTKIAYTKNTLKARWWAELDFDLGYYNSYNFPSVSDRVANQLSCGYNFGFVKPLHKFSNKLYFWGGVSISGRYAYNQFINYSNSADNYTFLNNFGINGLLHYTFLMADRWWSLEWTMNIPLATYYMRPGYSINFPNNEIGEHGFTSFNEFYEIDSEIRLVFPFRNKNKIAIEYHWDYYSLNTSNKVQYGSHGIFLTAQFKLNKK